MAARKTWVATRWCLLTLFAISMSSLLRWNRSVRSDFQPDSAFRGKVVVYILNETQRDNRFLVDLQTGKVTASATEEKLPSAPKGSAIFNRCRGITEIQSPDARLVGACDATFVLTVSDSRTKTQLREWPLEHDWYIRGIAWSPDSQSLAVLLSREKLDFSPLGIFSDVLAILFRSRPTGSHFIPRSLVVS